MKRILSYILTVILLCGVTVSCSEKDNDSSQADEAVIMFFSHSEGLGYFIRQNIEDMKTAIRNRGGLGNKRLFVINAAESYPSAKIFEITYVQNKDTSFIAEKIIDRDYTLEYSSDNQHAIISSLHTLFSKVKSMANAKSYSMIIGSHGSAWLPAGICLDDMNNRYSATKRRKSFGTANSDRQIANASLATALHNAGIHLNYLLFDACYMGNVETLFDFQNICDYFIASPNEIMGVGMPYATIGNDLLNNNYRGVIDGYYDYYSTYNAPYGSLSLYNTASVSDLAKAVQDINVNHFNSSADISSVKKMDGLSPALFFDFAGYFKAVCNDSAALSALNAALKSVVVYERHTEKAFTYWGFENEMDISDICGIATSQPTTNTGVTNLLRDSGWWIVTH